MFHGINFNTYWLLSWLCLMMNCKYLLWRAQVGQISQCGLSGHQKYQDKIIFCDILSNIKVRSLWWMRSKDWSQISVPNILKIFGSQLKSKLCNTDWLHWPCNINYYWGEREIHHITPSVILIKLHIVEFNTNYFLSTNKYVMQTWTLTWTRTSSVLSITKYFPFYLCFNV